MSEEQLFKKIRDLEDAYVAGLITAEIYFNEYRKLVNVKQTGEIDEDANRE